MLLILVLLKLASAGGYSGCVGMGFSCNQDDDCCQGPDDLGASSWQAFCNLEEQTDLGALEGPGTCTLGEELSTCQRCRRLCYQGEQCWNGGDNEEWCVENCVVNECSCSCTHCQPTEISGYEAMSPGCVSGENIQLYSDKTVQQCGDLCDAQNGVGHPCVGFEVWANHGGDKGNYNVGNCQLSSSTNTQGCDAEGYNLDFYTKVDVTCIPSKTQACRTNAEARAASNAEARAASNAEARAASNAEAHAASSASSAAMTRARNADIALYEVYDVATYLCATVGLATMVHFLWWKCRGNKDYESINASTEEI